MLTCSPCKNKTFLFDSTAVGCNSVKSWKYEKLYIISQGISTIITYEPQL